MSELSLIEKAALAIGLEQVRRGEPPTPNVATQCVLALDRIVNQGGSNAE